MHLSNLITSGKCHMTFVKEMPSATPFFMTLQRLKNISTIKLIRFILLLLFCYNSDLNP